jgi:hypothetical protein
MRALVAFALSSLLAASASCSGGSSSPAPTPSMPVTNPNAHYNPSPVTAPVRRVVGITAAADSLSIVVLRRLGITRVRMAIIWNNYLDVRHFADDRATVVSSGGHTVAEFFAMDLAAFQAAGIEPLVVVHTPPSGMTLASGITAMPTFMASLASTFPGLRWQILNEMDGDDTFNAGWFEVTNGAVSDSTRGDRYGQVLGPVYDAIKAADSTATVVSGGVNPASTAFYNGLVARASGKFNAYAVHAYGPPATPGFVEHSTRLRPLLGATPLWCTETGNNQADETTQASDLGNLLDENDRNNRYDRLYLYALISPDGYGLVRSDGSLRQAALLLRERTAP